MAGMRETGLLDHAIFDLKIFEITRRYMQLFDLVAKKIKAL
jgi:hypothetical protein